MSSLFANFFIISSFYIYNASQTLSSAAFDSQIPLNNAQQQIWSLSRKWKLSWTADVSGLSGDGGRS